MATMQRASSRPASASPSHRRHDAANRGAVIGFEQLGNHFVRRDHEVFDEQRRAIRHLGFERDRTIVGGDGACFDTLNVQGAAAMARVPEQLGRVILQADLRRERL